MGVDLIVNKIQNEKDPRELYEVAVHLCLDDVVGLVEAAKKHGVVNQVGAMIDLSLKYLLSPDTHRYAVLKNLGEQLYDSRNKGTRSFYKDEDQVMSDSIKKYMFRLNSPDMNDIMKKWELVITLDSEKFKQVYEQEYEDRQEASRKYSSVNKGTIRKKRSFLHGVFKSGSPN